MAPNCEAAHASPTSGVSSTSSPFRTVRSAQAQVLVHLNSAVWLKCATAEVMAVLNNYLSGFASRQAAWGQLRQRAGLTDEQWAERLERYLATTRNKDPELAAD